MLATVPTLKLPLVVFVPAVFERVSVPPATAIKPVLVFAPVSSSVPVPLLVKATWPDPSAMAPLMVVLPEPATVRVFVPAVDALMPPAMARLFVALLFVSV